MMRNFLIVLLTGLLLPLGVTNCQQSQWSLEECIKYAIENNIQIKQQVIQTQVQENALDLAKMKLVPTLNSSVSHNYNFGRALDQTTYTFYNQTMQADYLYVGGETPVFKGMQNHEYNKEELSMRCWPPRKISSIYAMMWH